MGTFVLTLLKRVLGYVAGKMLKPEVAVELFLDFGDTIAARTDTKVDDKIFRDLRTALGHDEKDKKK